MTKTAIHPSTGETLTYEGARNVQCATFARGRRTRKVVGRKTVWTVVDSGATAQWWHVGWSSQDLLKAQQAARGTNPYYAEYLAVEAR